MSLILLWRFIKQVLYKKSIQCTVPIMGEHEEATDSVVEEVNVSVEALGKTEFRSLWRLFKLMKVTL